MLRCTLKVSIFIFLIIFYSDGPLHANEVPLSISNDGVVKAPKLCIKKIISKKDAKNQIGTTSLEGEWDLCALSTMEIKEFVNKNRSIRCGVSVNAGKQPYGRFWQMSIDADGGNVLSCEAICFNFACD